MSKLISQIFINGCGPVGLTLAKCLASSPYIQSITLLDRKIPSCERILGQIPNQRVYSLNGPSLSLYKKLGIFDRFRLKGQMSQIQVVSKQANQYINWSNNQSNIVQNDEIVYNLIKDLKENHSNKINFIENQIKQFSIDEESCRITLNDSSQVECKLIVGSDGNKSKVKQMAGINTYGWSYRQKGIVCSMKIDKKYPNFTGYQIYHDKNVLALLPLWDNYVSLVWSVNIPDFQHLMTLSESQFQQKLNNVITNANLAMGRSSDFIEIPKIQSIQNKRLAFPLSTMQSQFYTKSRLALVGDAAHTIHPMAGLGVNSGIMDSIFLANSIIKNIKTGNDIGDLISLSSYEAEAKAFNYKNSLAMEGLKKFFEVNIPPIEYLKGMGLSLFQNSSGFKEIAKNLVEGDNLKYEWEQV